MNTRIAATTALTLTALLALAGCAGTGGGGMDNMPGMESSTSDQNNVNNADIMFTTMMIPHHEQAVEMSDTLLAKVGIAPDVIAIAEQIKAAQAPEIDLMESWLDDWGTGAGDMGHGMMSDTDMQALEEATGDAASRLFLQQMIEHHEGAIDMAQSEMDKGTSPDVLALAQQIIDTQTTEIATMKEILEAL